MSPWDPRRPPRQPGRTMAVTGATSGIGYFVAEQLAATGAHVVLLGRRADRLETAMRSIGALVPEADLSAVTLDLADLDSVSRAAQALGDRGGIDVLVANAGVISAGPLRRTTAQGLELTVGTNHLGHFAFIARTLPSLLSTPGSRVVSLGSYVTHRGTFDLDQLMSEDGYSGRGAYIRSKHATEVFGFELDRRLRAAGADTASLVAHPGAALDQLSPRREGVNEPSGATRALYSLASALVQGKHRGAWPVVRAALDPQGVGGGYYGPSRLVVGRPEPVRPPAASTAPGTGARLWALSEELTGTPFTIPAR
ncbi:SDR family NAD(P)-dependent oxidoreductase [Nocardiopsis synnemataformans]|uniref:SDR family NAD(P)-dependent oxidoreductase n=1 Tax=Nocardiopsis synnemataformans TaxID=61305 RepID=UPI003EB9E438